ncbi:MAG: dihydrolipoyl dehydrogenase [Pseudooceanicola nanhaiensis]
MTEHHCDVAVIGAGTAGLAAERKARHGGARTLLIDPEFAGTTCATVGCMPSKLLIAAAEIAHDVRRAVDFGIRTEVTVDGPGVMRRVRRLRDDFANGVRDAIDRLPDGIAVRARARFSGPDSLALDTGETVRFRAAVIATGSAPAIPEPFRDLGDLLLTNETVFDLRDLPESVGVIGAGPLGLELAQALARLGVRVELYDQSETVAGLPRETSDHLAEILGEEFPLHLGVTPETTRQGGRVRVTTEGQLRDFDRLLIATGRPPQLDGLSLENAGLTLDGDGMPAFDPRTLQCGDSAVFIAGDANGDRPLLHAATDEGAIAGHNAACHPDISGTARKLPLAITFTRPTAAVLGTGPDADPGLVTGRADFTDQGRTRVEARPGGLLRLHAQPATGRLVGADLCLPHGEHIAHQLAWVMSRGISVQEMLELPFYHPTVAEGMKDALQALCGQIDQPPGWTVDRGRPAGT